MYVRLLIENRPYQQQVNANYPNGLFKILSQKNLWDFWNFCLIQAVRDWSRLHRRLIRVSLSVCPSHSQRHSDLSNALHYIGPRKSAYSTQIYIKSSGRVLCWWQRHSNLSDALLVRVSLHRVYASISKVPLRSFVGGDENSINQLHWPWKPVFVACYVCYCKL